MNMAAGGRGDAGGAEMTGCKMTGPAGGKIPMPLDEDFFKNYDSTNFDATGHCDPMSYTRSMNAPVPTEIVQRSDVIVFLHESMFAFHVVYMDGRKHPAKEEALQTTWYGHSTGKWDGDTLVVDTVGPSHERGSAPDGTLQAPGRGSSLVRGDRGRSEVLYEAVDQLQSVYADEAGTGNHGVRAHGEQQGSLRAPH